MHFLYCSLLCKHYYWQVEEPVNSDMGGHFFKLHRCCCHRKDISEDEEGRPVFNSRYTTTMENLPMKMTKKRKASSTITLSELEDKHDQASKEEKQYAGDSTLAGEFCMKRTFL